MNVTYNMNNKEIYITTEPSVKLNRSQDLNAKQD